MVVCYHDLAQFAEISEWWNQHGRILSIFGGSNKTQILLKDVLKSVFSLILLAKTRLIHMRRVC